MRELICADSLIWLKDNKDKQGAILTSLPDMEEIGMDINEWASWFQQAASLCLNHIKGSGNPIIFYQTDRKYDGSWFSKANLLISCAKELNIPLIWHKICLTSSNEDAINLYRPGYSHLLCFSEVKKPGKITPDVFKAGHKIYDNGIGIHAARIALDYISNHTKDNVLIDPFCGRGTVLSLAEFEYKFDKTIGIDIDEDQVNKCKDLLDNDIFSMFG